MRPLTKIEFERIKLLTENSVEYSLIEPTKTGLEKSILDATIPVRNFLKEKNLHDYEIQKQGPESKIQLKAFLIHDKGFIHSKCSLYKPITKNGDPRIWFSGLPDYANPNDILGIIEFDSSIYLINITQFDTDELITGEYSNPLKEIVRTIKTDSLKIAEELLFKLRKIAKRGPIQAIGVGDTSIGRTLEAHLGININSSKEPDYKGIELKSFRDNKKSKRNRKNLFAQVPDWSISKLQSFGEIVTNFGYERRDCFRLNCTVSTKSRNSQRLILRIDPRSNLLIENSESFGDFVAWRIPSLHSRLSEKHNETFWVAGNSTIQDGKEYFQFTQVNHTRKPIVSQFDVLLEQGIITLDHLIKMDSVGKVKERGPLFKITTEGIGLLFPPSKTHNLL